MKLNRGQHRPLEVTRGRADRDPRFVAVWYSGFGAMMPQEPPPWEPAQRAAARDAALAKLPPFELVPPAPVRTDPDADKWRAVLAHADTVHALLQDEPDLDHAVLFETVRSLLDSAPSPDDIVSAYRARIRDQRHG